MKPKIKKIKEVFDAACEPPRALVDFAKLKLVWPKIKDKLPDGDGHPVLFLPGFLSSDNGFTTTLRACVEEKGYKTYGWDNGRNMGFDEKTAKALKKRLKEVYKKNGKKKVTLIGHSLGGVYARELAREFPEMVRGVITLASPFGMLDDADKGARSPARKAYDMLNPGASPLDDAGFEKRCLTPPPVPTTSIYTKGDGIVNWKAALNPVAPETENIEVDGSHIGMVFNPLALSAVLDRLSQPEGAWQPFDAKKYSHAVFPDTDPQGNVPANPDFKHDKKNSIFKGSRKKPKP
ncbi:MAG: alpha/beta fold hydrolase [Alphaproteobacteria bacterium]